jgi:mannose-1-phosphate guanylyltransferase
MRLILLSGGSGKRLWPLSNDVRSKQFLQLLPSPNGETESMIQRIARQVRASNFYTRCKSVTVAAGEIQLEQLRMQLGRDTDVVTEPARRDTFLAIALAAAFLKDVKGAEDDEKVICIPVDSFVDDEYFEMLEKIEEALGAGLADIVLMGAVPRHASEKYGYIIPKDGSAGACLLVDSFVEKPPAEEAARLIEKGALWNGGVFGFRLRYLLDIIVAEILPDIPEDKRGASLYDTLRANFTDLKRRSFDYEVVEKASSIAAVPYGGAWKDLGTWETFTEELAANAMGHVYLDDSAKGTHVMNELDLPVVVMGTSDLVVAANHEGILVAPKGETYRLKEAVDHLSGRPMQEERRWGKYVVLDYCTEDGKERLTKKLTLLPGKLISYQSHKHRIEIWTVIDGEGLLYLNGEKRPVGPGDVVRISEGDKHGIKAVTTLEIIEVQLGDSLTEDDIVRYELSW